MNYILRSPTISFKPRYNGEVRHDHHMRHERAHLVLSYPVSLFQRLYTLLFMPLAILFLIYAVFTLYPALTKPLGQPVPLSDIIIASFYTLGRITIAYVLAVIVAVPLALLAVSTRTLGRILLPIFDIFESIPILALFPVVILLFVQFNFLNGAAVFILFINMLWNIVFTLVGGLKMIPQDITYAAHVFGIRGFSYLRKVILPGVFPQLVTGSILAVAEGWNLVIIAEALHTYIPGGTSSQDLYGVGSIMVHAAANAQNDVFVASILVMIVFIAVLNLFVWQRLLRFAERFRFD